MSFLAPFRCPGRRIPYPMIPRHMSVRPPDSHPLTAHKKITIQTLQTLRKSRTPITVLTAYDYPTALACSLSSLIDVVLVGDSLAQVCLGLPSTTSLTLEMMLHHCAAVARGTTTPLLIADMPYGSFQVSEEDTVRNAIRLVREGGVEGVKLEGGYEMTSRVRALTSVGIPVLGHVGLLPQRHVALSGYRVQGKNADDARQILRNAMALEQAGVFGIVLESVPWKLASYVTTKLSIPTIGIGAGPGTSGQVLVWDDAMGRWSGHEGKFVRRFAEVRHEEEKGLRAYAEAVKSSKFPEVRAESYEMSEGEWERFLDIEGEVGWETEGSEKQSSPP